jgi:hypothetical protein
MCCGRNRPTHPSMSRVTQPLRLVHHNQTRPTSPMHSNVPQTVSPMQAITYFQYNGRTALTVRGPVSGTIYRFQSPGRRVVVDLRDRQSLAGIPQLSEVSSL